MIAVVAVISAVAAYLTQRRAATTSPEAPQGALARVQALMRIGVPVSVLGSGLIFPLGLLIYWCASNVWSYVQLVWTLRSGGG